MFPEYDDININITKLIKSEENANFRDSFARGILLKRSSGAELRENSLVRCHVLIVTTFIDFIVDFLRNIQYF